MQRTPQYVWQYFLLLYSVWIYPKHNHALLSSPRMPRIHYTWSQAVQEFQSGVSMPQRAMLHVQRIPTTSYAPLVEGSMVDSCLHNHLQRQCHPV